MIPIMPYTYHTQTLLFPCRRNINFCLIRTLNRQKLHILCGGFDNGKHKLNICQQVLRTSTQLQNGSLHFVNRARTAVKCKKSENRSCKTCKTAFFIVKYATLSSLPRFLKKTSEPLDTPTQSIAIFITNEPVIP